MRKGTIGSRGWGDRQKLGCVPTPISRAEAESSLERKVGYTREKKRLPSRCHKCMTTETPAEEEIKIKESQCEQAQS